MTRDQFLTQHWNNLLSLILGIPLFAFVVAVIATTILSDTSAFIGIAIIGSAY